MKKKRIEIIRFLTVMFFVIVNACVVFATEYPIYTYNGGGNSTTSIINRGAANAFQSGDVLSIKNNISATGSDIGNLGDFVLTVTGANAGSNTLFGSTTTTPTLAGFTVNAAGDYTFDNLNLNLFKGRTSTTGGAITNAGTITVRNTNFTDNIGTRAGAIYNSGHADIYGSVFTSNTPAWAGGAIYSLGTLHIEDSVFTKNSSLNALGGAFYVSKNATINTSYFSWNNAATYGGAIYNAGGATLTVTDTNFENNGRNYNGGGTPITLTLNGGAIYNVISCFTDFYNSSFTGNAAIDSGGAIYNAGTLNSYTGTTFTKNFTTGANSLGGAIWTLRTTNIENNDFSWNYAGESGGAIYNASPTFTVTGTSFENNGKNYNDGGTPIITTLNGGAVSNINTATFNNSLFNANASVEKGGAIYNTKTATFTNSIFTNNTTAGQGGAIYNSGTVSIIANGADVKFTGNTAAGGGDAIYLSTTSTPSFATLNLNAATGNKIIFNDGIGSDSLSNQINIGNTLTGGIVEFNQPVTNSTVNLYGGTLTLKNENLFDGNNLRLNGGTLNLMNNRIGTMALNSMNLSAGSTTNIGVDIDLANSIGDKITSNSLATGTGRLNISAINAIGDTTAARANILIADDNIKGSIQSEVSTIDSLIYRYNVSYDGSSGNLTFLPQSFNPAVLISPVQQLAGVYSDQKNAVQQMFQNVDNFMNLPKYERVMREYRNRTASADGQFVFSPTFLPEESAGVWVKNYCAFENIPLRNGPNVSNVSYGVLVGEDTELTPIGHGFSGYLTAYAGYNGSHQNYGQVGTYQNGGLVGLTGTAYKGDFFASLTADVGASAGSSHNNYGTDEFTSLYTGVALKTGYNFEFLRGKLILQPNFMIGYTFADTFDYMTASGVNITSNPLNAIQIVPGVKIIGNLENGWQPYLAVNMVWNILDTARFYANEVQLPQMSIDPYVEYGIGIQRRWGDRFTGFIQAMARGGGINGVALQFGLRWAL